MILFLSISPFSLYLPLFVTHSHTLSLLLQTFRYPIARIVASGREKIEQSGQLRYNGIPNLIHLTDDQTWALQEGIKVLRWLFEVRPLYLVVVLILCLIVLQWNRKRCEVVSHEKFYIDEIVDCCDLREDYFSYKQNRVKREREGRRGGGKGGMEERERERMLFLSCIF